MSNLVPSNDYRLPPAPMPAKLGRDNWNAVMASLSQRIRSIEGKGAELDDLIADLSFNGQTRIDAAITPLIEQVRRDIVTVQATIEAVVRDAANAATAVTDEVRERVSAIEVDVANVEAAFARILAGMLPAANVTESDDRRFVSTAQRDEIAKLRADLTKAAVDQAKADAANRRFAAAYALSYGRL